MIELPEFLLARYAEDEDAARRAAFGYGADWTNETDDDAGWSVVHADGQRDMVGCEDRDVTEHIARHDPARVLAECASKRELIKLITARRHLVVDDCWYTCPAATKEVEGETTCNDSAEAEMGTCDCGRDADVNQALALLASVYREHPDYREEWKP